MTNYWLIDRPIAHRGYHKKEDNIPENSLLAFQRAIDNNLNIELDVQITTDNKVVVFHDQTAKRMAGVDKKIIDMSYEEVKNLKLDGLDVHPPLLEEVLELVNGQVGIVIELKSLFFSPTFRLERHVKKILKTYNGLYCIKSFNPLTEIWFFNHFHKVTRGILVGVKIEWLNKMMKFCFPFCNYCSFNVDMLPNDMVEKGFRQKKKPLISWTVDSIEDVEKVKQYADNIVFENLNIDVVEEYYNYNINIIKDYPDFKV